MSHSIVIFGASGDLTSRKLVPSIYRLFCKGRLPDDFRVVGFSRSPFSHDQWRRQLAKTTAQFTGDDFDASAWRDFSRRLFYCPGDIGKSDDYRSLTRELTEHKESASSTRVYYLATAPRHYEEAISGLGRSGLADQSAGIRRVVIEKPFGTDLASARGLNEAVHGVFSEQHVFRIDHYLGKETVQNVLVLRFANTIFEPIWNRNYIDHVQITAAEEVTVGRRGGYYDRAGVLRDMFQNHLLQLLTFIAIEAPLRFEADAVRNEKVKVLQAVRPLSPAEVARDTFRGQYRGYRDEPDVAPQSRTATFAAAKVYIDNWRWQGVPFYLRSGKAMSCRTTQIVIQFREPPHMMFSGAASGVDQTNRLVIQIQPAEGIQLHFLTKVPDAEMDLRMTDLDFRFDRQFLQALPGAYERLLLDVMAGDASLFARSDEVELAWSIIDPIADHWEADGLVPAVYQPGGWGPAACTEWMRRQGREWFDVCPVLH